ncbi:diguanylate cyclase [Oceanobacter mangrovi]|uniref:diguanylate cyclase n=1 Tax=Oceanobacter mangrovi TaxID=2862510 RepID=UPI001C8EF12C|nr:diguanylate cyclase [Oceanobacter mangrovi]
MNTQLRLQSLVYRGFLTSALIPLLVIEACLLLLYFGANWFVFSSYKNTLLDEVHNTIGQTAIRKAENIDQQLQDVEHLAQIMRADHEHFFKQLDQCHRPVPDGMFLRHDNGALYKSAERGGASLYYSSSTSMDDTTWQKAICSESLDPLLESLVNTSPLVTQAYLNTWDDMNRLYPFMADAAGQYGPVLQMEDYNFYYLADAKHDPSRKPMWTGMYLDPAGQGWMTSVVVPIYRDNFLEGVSGLDITIDSIVKNVLNEATGWEGARFLLDDKGLILAMPPWVEEVFDLKELRDHVYRTSISGTVEKPEEFNLLNSPEPEVRRRMAAILASKELRGNLESLRVGSREYLLNAQRIPTTGWLLVTIADKQATLEPIVSLQRSIQRAGFAAMLLMVLFYILFFLYLEYKSRRISVRISEPIRELSRWTNQLGEELSAARLEPVGIVEIDSLYRDVNRMSSFLEEKTKELVESRTRERLHQRESEILEQLATTDRLSNLYNRRKLDDMLRSEVDRSERSDVPFSIVLMDIDHFKDINDNLGHAIGDQVIIELSRMLKNTVRKIDAVGRWGGDEFMVICPMTDLDGALQLASNVREAINELEIDEVGKVSSSLGVACWRPGEDLEQLINRADRGLYNAKRLGRNRVATESSSDEDFSSSVDES